MAGDSDSKVVQFGTPINKVIEPVVHSKMVEELEKQLALAKEGKLNILFLASFAVDGPNKSSTNSWFYNASTLQHHYEVLGSIESEKARMLKQIHEWEDA